MKLTPSTPTHYICNGGLGDTIASSPVLKYAIDKIHTDGKYLISAMPYNREILWFVPDDKFNHLFNRYEFQEPYNQVRFRYDHSGIPKSNISQVASMHLLNKILKEEDYSYPLYPKDVNVGKFNLDLKRCVIIPVGFRSHIRKWNEITLKKLTEWIIQNDYIPVLIGNEQELPDPKQPFDSHCKLVNLDGMDTCVNLIGKTEIIDLIGIFQKSACVIGYDSGMIHLAGLTDIPIICAYTYVNPNARMFARHGKMGWNFQTITPGSDQCRFCYTDWHINNYVFENCWSGTLECCQFKLDQFIEPLKKVLNK